VDRFLGTSKLRSTESDEVRDTNGDLEEEWGRGGENRGKGVPYIDDCFFQCSLFFGPDDERNMFLQNADIPLQDNTLSQNRTTALKTSTARNLSGVISPAVALCRIHHCHSF
jgi:hypothetical protein